MNTRIHPSQTENPRLLFGLSRVARLGAAVFLLTIPARTAAPNSHSQSPFFSFGLIADVQYADKDSAGERRYRESLPKLRQCLADLNQQPLAFIANLGDTIDGRNHQSLADLEVVLDVFHQATAPVYHVIGNHCLEAPREKLLPALGLTNGYYTFRVQDWLFVGLDTMEVSLKAEPGTQPRREAEALMAREPTLPSYNGAVGQVQLDWLRAQLARAREEDLKVILLSHHPLATQPGHDGLLAWNAAAVRGIVSESGRVIACLAGHDHEGAYTFLDGVHYVTSPGMVEAPTDGNCYAVVEVYENCLQFHGAGEMPSRTLPLAPATRVDE